MYSNNYGRYNHRYGYGGYSNYGGYSYGRYGGYGGSSSMGAVPVENTGIPLERHSGPPLRISSCDNCQRPAFVSAETNFRCEGCRGEATSQGHRWNERDRSKVYQYYRSGYSLRSIALRFGRTQYGIACQLRDYGLLPTAEEFAPPRPGTGTGSSAATATQRPAAAAAATTTAVSDSDVLRFLERAFARRHDDDAAQSREYTNPPATATPRFTVDDLAATVPCQEDLEAMECCICTQIMEDPVSVVGCGHTFCRQCVDRTRRMSPNVTCPQCRGSMRSVAENTSLARSIKAALEAKKNGLTLPDPRSKAATTRTAKKKPKAVAKKTVAKKVPAKKAPVKKASAEKAPVKKTSAKKTPAKKAPVKKAPAKKASAEKAAVKKTSAKKTPAKKAPAKKAPAKKAPAKKVASKAVAKKPAAKRAPAKKPVAKKAPAKKAPAKKSPARSTSVRTSVKKK